MRKLAPIVLFVYNRPELTKETISYLQSNILAGNSDLIIFSDGPKNNDQIAGVNEVRDIIRDVKGFNSVKIFTSDTNKGLANSIIDGVTKVLGEFGKVVVLEDDLITSKYFLSYMNDALEYFEKNKNIWSISGYTPFIEFPDEYNNDVYAIPRACSWGWATWLDRWNLNDWEIKDYQQFKNNKVKINEFNKPGNDMSYMLEDQIKGNINSWAIRWCFNQFNHKSYTIYPKVSFIQNEGFSGESTHGSIRKHFKSNMEQNYNLQFSNVEVNREIVQQFAKYYNMNVANYIGIFLKKIGLYKKVKNVYKILKR